MRSRAVGDRIVRVHEDRTSIRGAQGYQDFTLLVIFEQCTQGVVGAHAAIQFDFEVGDHQLHAGQYLFDFHAGLRG